MKNIDDSQYLLMKQGLSYRIDDYFFGKQKECAQKLSVINALPFGNEERETLLHQLFHKLGNHNIIKEGFHCNYGFNISIGDDCYINFDVTILDSYEVSIGNRVFIAPQVVISPVTHPLLSKQRKQLIVGKIVIEDDVWIGAGSVILPGVTIHSGAVIGANSLVKEDIPANTVVAGSPARIIKGIRN